MKSKSDYYAEIGLKAARRAAVKVWKKAQLEGYKIPIWNGKEVEYFDPEVLLRQAEEDSEF